MKPYRWHRSPATRRFRGRMDAGRLWQGKAHGVSASTQSLLNGQYYFRRGERLIAMDVGTGHKKGGQPSAGFKPPRRKTNDWALVGVKYFDRLMAGRAAYLYRLSGKHGHSGMDFRNGRLGQGLLTLAPLVNALIAKSIKVFWQSENIHGGHQQI